MTVRDELTERHSKDIELMHKMYVDAERQYLEFNLIVPYVDNDNDVYSPRLVSMLQGLGSQIDGVVRILTSLLSLEVSSDAFPAYMKTLNRNGMLSVQTIQLRENGKEFSPFELDSEYSTVWRKAYNDTKHKLPHGAYSGRYGHVVNSLGALAILHELTYKAMDKKVREIILDSKNWMSQKWGVMDTFGIFQDRRFCSNYSHIFNYPMMLSLYEQLPE